MGQPQDPGDKEPSALDKAEQLKRAWEIGIWLIEAGSIVSGVVKAQGGPVPFLAQVGAFGTAAYIALVGLVVVNSNSDFLSKMSSGAATILVAVVALGGGALIRFVIAQGLDPNDLDSIGQGFMAFVGVIVLLIPLGLLVRYFKPSSP